MGTDWGRDALLAALKATSGRPAEEQLRVALETASAGDPAQDEPPAEADLS